MSMWRPRSNSSLSPFTVKVPPHRPTPAEEEGCKVGRGDALEPCVVRLHPPKAQGLLEVGGASPTKPDPNPPDGLAALPPLHFLSFHKRNTASGLTLGKTPAHCLVNEVALLRAGASLQDLPAPHLHHQFRRHCLAGLITQGWSTTATPVPTALPGRAGVPEVVALHQQFRRTCLAGLLRQAPAAHHQFPTDLPGRAGMTQRHGCAA